MSCRRRVFGGVSERKGQGLKPEGSRPASWGSVLARKPGARRAGPQVLLVLVLVVLVLPMALVVALLHHASHPPSDTANNIIISCCYSTIILLTPRYYR